MKSVEASGITEFIKSNTGCDTDYFMVIPEVIQRKAGITTGITDNCPRKGHIYRVLGRFYISLTRFCETHCVLRIWQILSTQLLK